MQNLKIKGIRNIRDLSQVPVKDGKIKNNMLFRSSHLNGISPKTAEMLVKNFNLTAVVDLRTPTERSKKPDYKIDGVKYFEIPIFDYEIPGISRELKPTADNIPDLVEMYRKIMQGESLERLATAVKTVMNSAENGAVLFHCTQGKDRTGILTAILLLILGADKADIVKDYTFTNIINIKYANALSRLVIILKRDRVFADKVKAAMLAKTEYIDEVFKVVDEKGIDGFVSDVLGISGKEINSFIKAVKQ